MNKKGFEYLWIIRRTDGKISRDKIRVTWLTKLLTYITEQGRQIDKLQGLAVE